MRKVFKLNDNDYINYVENLLKKKSKKSEYIGKSNETLKARNNDPKLRHTRFKIKNNKFNLSK